MLQRMQRLPGQIWGFLLPAGNLCLLPVEPGLMHDPGALCSSPVALLGAVQQR